MNDDETLQAMVAFEQVKDNRQQLAERAFAPPSYALRQLGNLHIIREVGKWEMRIVYEAEQVSLGRHFRAQSVEEAGDE